MHHSIRSVQSSLIRRNPLLLQQNKINESFTIPLGKTIGRAPVPNYEGSDNLDLNDYSNYGDSKTVEEYYKSILPGYNQQKNVNNKSHINRPHYPQPQNNLNEYPTQDILLEEKKISS